MKVLQNTKDIIIIEEAESYFAECFLLLHARTWFCGESPESPAVSGEEMKKGAAPLAAWQLRGAVSVKRSFLLYEGWMDQSGSSNS